MSASGEARPLAGRCVIVTRPRHQSASLSEPLRRLGAEVVEEPAIRIEPPEDPTPLDRALQRLGDYDWLVFTSTNAVEAVASRYDLEELAGADVRIAAIGPATASAARSRGLTVDLVPDRFVAEAVFESLARRGPLAGLRFLLPRADIARPALPRLLEEAGAIVDVRTAYRTVPDREAVSRALDRMRHTTVDAVTFTSASTVRSFLEGAGREPFRAEPAVAPASIGPITSDALRELGVEPVIEAARYDNDGLVEAIRVHFTQETST